jgi:hypothetical protein
MIKTIKHAFRFNPVIQDYRMSQGIENLADLITDEGDGRDFFLAISSRGVSFHGELWCWSKMWPGERQRNESACSNSETGKWIRA